MFGTLQMRKTWKWAKGLGLHRPIRWAMWKNYTTMQDKQERMDPSSRRTLKSKTNPTKSSKTVKQNAWFLIIIILTISLPWCHLKMTSKSVKFEILNLFQFCFLSCMSVSVKWFSSKCTVLNEKVICYNIQDQLLSKYTVCMCMRFSGQKFDRLGQWLG